MTSGYAKVMFISYATKGRMPFVAVQTLDNAHPLFALVIKPGFYLHHLGVTDHHPASGSL